MPKALTQEELRTQTRELVLEAAQRVFLAKGYHATTVAAIAYEAGRSQGSIYGNFAGKEALCQEVIGAHLTEVITGLASGLAVASSVSERIDITVALWENALAQSDWNVLLAEYIVATRQNEEQQHSLRTVFENARVGVRTLLLGQAELESVGPLDSDSVEGAVTDLLASVVGLVIGHTFRITKTGETTASFRRTLVQSFRRFGVTDLS